MTRTQIEVAAMKQANARKKPLQFTSMLFDTSEGLLLLDWDRASWNCRWIGEAHKLELPATQN